MGWFRLLPELGLEPILASHQVGDFQRWSESRGIPSYRVGIPFPNKWFPLPFLYSLWKLRTIVRRHRVELIHCNEHDCYPMGAYLGQLTQTPVVCSVHFTMLEGYCSWAFGKHCPDRLYFVSSANLENCLPGIGGVVPEDRRYVLTNALDLKHFRPDAQLRDQFRKRWELGEAPVIGVACALRERKQLEHLVAAAEALPENVRVVIAGGSVPDEVEYGEQILKLAKSKLGDRLVCTGHLSDLRPFYNGLDLFVNTSQEEACSISVIEAMACGCPVVGYASRSVHSQILPDGGEITPQDDAAKLGQVVKAWLSDPAKLDQYRTSARLRAEREFDIEVKARDLFDDYRAILSTRLETTSRPGVNKQEVLT